MAKVIIFGQVKLLKSNPWLSGALAEVVKAGLAKVKKEFIVASPPPWMGDPSKLSDAQIAQVLRFSQAASEIKGKGTIKQRIANIKSKASGPTGYPVKPKVRISKIQKIMTIAQARGGIRTPAPAITAIRE